MQDIKIFLFGSFQVVINGKSITQFKADSARALLSYLVIEPEIAHPRESLAALFWPDSSKSTALENLRQALNRLRTAIGDKNSQQPFLLTSRKSIQINPEVDFWLDAADFMREFETAQRMNIELAVPNYERVIKLYRGDFLADFNFNSPTFEEWMFTNLGSYMRMAMDAFNVLRKFAYQSGDFQKAIHYANSQVELDPWREDIKRDLFKALAMNGQRNDALTEYQIFKTVLFKELGVEPEAETTQIYNRIRNGELGGIKEKKPQTPRYNFPSNLTSFIGRQEELEELKENIINPNRRLITLLGMGGVGKTRLAIQVVEVIGDMFIDGAAFIPIHSLEDKTSNQSDDLLVTGIADALNIHFFGSQDPKTQVLDYLSKRNLLLVLDNFEDVIESANFVVELLKNSPYLTILVTSRERLALQIETAIKLTGLIVPDDIHTSDLDNYPSVELFNERASRAPIKFRLEDHLEGVIKVCQLVGGLPLAIEFAASLIEIYTPSEIAENIELDIDSLSSQFRDLPDRHKSLRAVFENSWRQRTESEKITLSKISVFRGSFDSQAAEKITDTILGDLNSLVDSSFIAKLTEDRYEMHEMVRHFTAENLRRGRSSLEKKFEQYYLKMVAEKEEILGQGHSPNPMDEILQEYSNIRWAWIGAFEKGQYSLLESSLSNLTKILHLSGLYKEGQSLMDFGISIIGSGKNKKQPSQKLAANLHLARGQFCFEQALYSEAAEAAHKVLDLIQGSEFFETQAYGYLLLSKTAVIKQDYKKAKEWGQRSLEIAEENINEEVRGKSLLAIGSSYAEQGRDAKAMNLYQQAFKIAEEGGNLEFQVRALSHLGDAASKLGKYDEAQDHYAHAMEINTLSKNRRFESILWYNLANILVRLGDYQSAILYFARHLQNSQRIGDHYDTCQALDGLAKASLLQGNLNAAAEYAQQALHTCQVYGIRNAWSRILNRLGNIYLAQEEYEKSKEHFDSALDINIRSGSSGSQLENLSGLTRLALINDRADDALEFVDQILDQMDNKSNVGSEDTVGIYLISYQVLRARKDKRAEEILTQAYQFLQEQAEKISAKDVRQKFREDVRSHRELLRLYEEGHPSTKKKTNNAKQKSRKVRG